MTWMHWIVLIIFCVIAYVIKRLWIGLVDTIFDRLKRLFSGKQKSEDTWHTLNKKEDETSEK